MKSRLKKAGKVKKVSNKGNRSWVTWLAIWEGQEEENSSEQRRTALGNPSPM